MCDWQLTALKVHAVDEWDEKRKNGRKFLEVLLTTFKADVNFRVKKKRLEATDTVPTKEKDQYEHPNEGKILFLNFADPLNMLF